MKLIKKLLSTFILMLVIMTSINIVEAKAIDNGIYIAPVLVDYRNPETGLIEDGGSEENYDLGLGMCNSIVGSQALIEVENGKKYITLRFSLISNISNVSIGVQSSSRGTYYNVSPEVTKSGGDWKDYRFQVTDENLYISPTMYVTPMQRNVKFFIKINSSAATAGSGDFVTKIQINTNSTQNQEVVKESNSNGNAISDNVNVNTEIALQSNNEVNKEENNVEVEDISEDEDVNEEVAEKINLEDEEGASEHKVTPKVVKQDKDSKKSNKRIIVMAIIAILTIGGSASAIIYKKHKKR